MTELPSIDVVLPWPAGSSDYPNLLDDFEQQDEGQFAKVINDITKAIEHIQGTLGTNPAGVSPTVKAALTNLQTALSNLTTAQNSLAAQVAVLATIPGPPNTYLRYIQGAPAAVWTIDHTLGRYPAVMVTDSAGTVVEGEITYDSLTRVTLTFSAPFAGEAYLS